MWHVMCHLYFFFFISSSTSGEAIRWRVCYALWLPQLGIILTTKYLSWVLFNKISFQSELAYFQFPAPIAAQWAGSFITGYCWDRKAASTLHNYCFFAQLQRCHTTTIKSIIVWKFLRNSIMDIDCHIRFRIFQQFFRKITKLMNWWWTSLKNNLDSTGLLRLIKDWAVHKDIFNQQTN